jgi:soluble cytochrome b562
VADVPVPLSVRQQGNTYSIKVMNRIKVAVENARVTDEKERSAMAKEKERYGHTYNQSITQYGGVMNASQAGNVSAQQVTVAALEDLRPALAEMRAFFKQQGESVDADEYVGLLASAEKAAAEKDEGKMLGYLKQIPADAWEIGKAVLPQVLLHYLKARGLA